MRKIVSFGCLLVLPFVGSTQINEDKMGAWYMYFFSHKFNEGPWGIQGDFQWRNWDLGGDMEQLLIRGGLTYTPKNTNVLLTMGFAHIKTGAYGKGTAISLEDRFYQEVMYPVHIAPHVYLNHRLRFEQRLVENQNFRTRYRYNLFINIPINNPEMESRTVYISLYNEIFLNGQRQITSDTEVEFFDRNRFYSAIGYIFSKELKTQVGVMSQTTSNWKKNQLQVSLHHSF